MNIEREPTPHPLEESVRRLFDTLETDTLGYSDIIIRLQDTFELVDPEFDFYGCSALIHHEDYPSEAEFDRDERAAKDKFAHFVIGTMSPYVEVLAYRSAEERRAQDKADHTTARREISAWHEITARHLGRYLRRTHDPRCERAGGACEAGSGCLYVKAEYFYNDPLHQGYFRSSYDPVGEQLDPEIVYDVAMIRGTAGVKAGLLLESYVNTLKDGYERRFSATHPLTLDKG